MLEAIFSMCWSVLVILCLIVLFFESRFGFALLNERNPDMHLVLFALQGILFIGIPGICICLLTLGWEVLRYLRKEGKSENPGD
jgi:hypothetical protein